MTGVPFALHPAAQSPSRLSRHSSRVGTDELTTSSANPPSASSGARVSTPPATTLAASDPVVANTPAPKQRSVEQIKACQDTPRSHSESSTRKDRGTDDPLADDRYRDLAQDIRPHCVGPMPLMEFLDFLPEAKTEEGKNPEFVFDGFTAMRTMDLTEEKSIYKPFVRMMVNYHSGPYSYQYRLKH